LLVFTVPVTDVLLRVTVSPFPEGIVNENVPVTWSAELKVTFNVPVGVGPTVPKQVVLGFSNSKVEMLSAPLLDTVNCVLKLNPDDVPTPPDIADCHTLPDGVCTALELPQPFTITASSSRIAISFMNFP
jgi:hypothetical protein